MIQDVDRTLRSLLERDALGGSGVGISFEAPSKAWAARQNGPMVSVYLYDVREDPERALPQYQEVRGEVDGRAVVVDRRMPPRMYALSYLVSAWTKRPEDEHRLLGTLLTCLLRHPLLPIVGAEPPSSLRMTVADLGRKERSSAELWNAFGGELRPSLDVVVTAAVDPDRHRPVGPLVTEKPVVRVRDRIRRS